MKIIPLTKGKIAIINNRDYARVKKFRWCASRNRSKWYARRRIPGTGQPGRTQTLHNFILGRPWIDHRNGNGLDCRRQNLRAATNSQNACNRGPQRNNTSGFKGVSRWHDGRWQAGIKLNRKRYYLGLFSTAELAAAAYDAAAIKYHGKFARINFGGSV